MIFYKYVGGGIAERNTIGCRTVIDPGIRILEDLRLKITPPNEFNDPFELTPRSKVNCTLGHVSERTRSTPEYFRGTYEEMVKKHGYPHPFEQFIKDLPTSLPKWFKVKAYKNQLRRIHHKRDLEQINEASKGLGILCVSKPNDSIPMWSYYGNHHRGIALGLDLAHPCLQTGYLIKSGPVRYRQDRYPVDVLSREWNNQFVSVIFIKSKVWKHEEEYRQVYRLHELLRPAPGPDGKQHYFLNIDAGAIREVIFGCCIERGYEQQIRAELKRRPRTFGHVKLLRCQRHPTRFEIQVVRA